MDCSMPGLPSPRAYSNSCPSSRWCHPTISSSVIPFSSCLQCFPASASFPMSQLFTSGGQSIGVSASASVFPMPSSPLRGYFFLLWTFENILKANTQSLKTSFVLCSWMVELYTRAITTSGSAALEFTQKGASWQPGLPPLQLLTPWVHLHFLCFWLFRRN